MVDKRTHRGPNPKDKKLFAPDQLPKLRTAVADVSLLLTKGYASKSSLKFVADKFSLTERQRLAVMRAACSDQQLAQIKQNQIQLTQTANKPIAIDGYNTLISIEAAMSNGLILKTRSGCYKDLASIHGSYKKVSETIPAIKLIADFLNENCLEDIIWLFDRPVSNSGRLKKMIEEMAKENNWQWKIELSNSPDKDLVNSDRIIASNDGIIIEKTKWLNLTAEIIKTKLPDTWLIDLTD
ncbi:MAG: DUF434 domain-containing protein [Planctomycetes bacterium]|nr:DUF434 domain-containing protein [Planctomycetota bacterium]